MRKSPEKEGARERMKKVSLDEVGGICLGVNVADTHVSEWEDGEKFQRFRRVSRPTSALFFLSTVAGGVYTEIGGDGSVHRTECQRGDILYIPENIRYEAVFHVPEAAENTTRTLNFDLFDERGERVIFSDHILILSNPLNPYMQNDFDDLHRCRQNPVKCNAQNISSLFFSILYHATRKHGTGSKTSSLRLAVQALEEEWNRNEKMEKYAALCGRSLTCFYQEFRAYTGMSPTQYRNSIRVRAAASDLANTDLTVRQIAARVGVDDEYYFSRMFKQMTGLSPKNYKKRTDER